MSRDKLFCGRRWFLGGMLGGAVAAALPRASRAESRDGQGELPTRVLGKTGVRVTAIGLGGARLPMLSDDAAVRLVEAAFEAGINFFDNAHGYADGRSERVYGRALRGKRQKIFLTSKSTERTRADAQRELEESLRNLQTEYLDLWQIHGVSTKEEVEQICGPNGALEAFVRAKQEGKARFIGFTGHHDPEVHAAMIERYDFDTIFMPLHAADPHYLSFEKRVLARAAEKNLGITAMKVTANGWLLRAITVEECLRYVLSLPVACAIMGCTTPGQLEDDLRAARSFVPLTPEEKAALLAKTERWKGPQLEYWKKAVTRPAASRLGA
jgi:aryl-alcohol dehydrogenase-like predicted oxidoreductase